MVRTRKEHSLTGRITPELVHGAWRAVRANKGAAGIDKVSVKRFELNLDANLERVLREMKSGTFRPHPARRVHIAKEPGKTRPLGIPAVRDRVAQEVLRQLLSPIFEKRFHNDSYGFRPKRGAHQAVERVQELHRQGHTHVLDADIKACFDHIAHSAIMGELAKVVADGKVLSLVERFLKAGVMENGVFSETREGFAFLGFQITSWSCKMREKSVEKFKTKVRALTIRSHNLDQKVVEKLNALIRGTAKYFARPWSACGDAYRTLDRWTRMRLRCMKLKRKSRKDNGRLRLRHLRRMGLLSLTDFIPRPSGP
jgi:hypothetical protein